ncbi:MAG TPA: LysM peptidoglycan-binding domain-containing protein, partial [Acidobacteriota bacterium]
IRLRRYRVRRGDTIGGIARRFGLSPMELARINHLSMRSKLRRGQGLALEAEPVTNSSRSARIAATSLHAGTRKVIHRVRSGETVTSIASQYHVNIRSISKWNHAATSLRTGQRLTIYLSK